MFGLLTRAALLLGSTAALFSTSALVAADDAAHDAHSLPIIFIHGLTASAKIADNLKANLSTDARPFVALTSCESACSTTERNNQVSLHIAKIRELVAMDARFANGYTLIGHSQGGALARAVIETMDDHKVHTFISLAGAGNGIFYGPQATDFAPAQTYLKYFAPLGNKTVFDWTTYTEADITSGKLQVDLIKVETANPQYQAQLTRSPAKSDWLQYNTFFPKLNNLEAPTTKEIEAEQKRRKQNFLKVQAAHYFASPYDETISPWQSAINGQYNDVASLEELEKNYSQLKVLPMTETPEYTQDTYGLQTLDKRGGLFLHTVEKVTHVCWVEDATSSRDGQLCSFKPVYENTYYPLLAPRVASSEPVKPHC